MNLMSPALNSPGLGDRNADTPDLAVDGHRVRLEWIRGRATQHRSRPDIEFRPMQWAFHGRAVEGAFAQWTLPVRTPGLGGAEAPFNAEHRHITHQQD